VARTASEAFRSRLERPLYFLRDLQGAICAAQVWQGDCILLFTSKAVAMAFADLGGAEVQPPFTFSRHRSEFLTQAVRSSGQGFIGGLIDLAPGARETAFVGFDVGPR
jgi:hypothetical protein